MLFAPLLASIVHATIACRNNQLYFGKLSSSLELEAFTLRRPATACNCCGLCHQNPACKSLTFDTDTNECFLYSKVGGFGDFSRQVSWNHKQEFFLMPNSSLTNQFCRSDSDCVTSGDSCRGRICTTDTTVTCRDIYHMNNGLPDHHYWGFINGQEIIIECSMKYGKDGYTLLLRAEPWGGWNINKRLNYTMYRSGGKPKTWEKYSILWAADFIRDSSNGSTYNVIVQGYRKDTKGTFDKRKWEYHYRSVIFTAPKSASILGDQPTSVSYTIESNEDFRFPDDSDVSFPYLMNSGGILFHMNMIQSSDYGAMIRTSGSLRWSPPADPSSYLRLYIRE